MAASAFQRSAFQNNAFQFGMAVTSTTSLELPVDYFMEDLPQYRASGRTYEPSRGRAREEVKFAAGPKGRISGPAASFTVRSTKRGYE